MPRLDCDKKDATERIAPDAVSVSVKAVAGHVGNRTLDPEAIPPIWKRTICNEQVNVCAPRVSREGGQRINYVVGCIKCAVRSIFPEIPAGQRTSGVHAIGIEVFVEAYDEGADDPVRRAVGGRQSGNLRHLGRYGIVDGNFEEVLGGRAAAEISGHAHVIIAIAGDGCLGMAVRGVSVGVDQCRIGGCQERDLCVERTRNRKPGGGVDDLPALRRPR